MSIHADAEFCRHCGARVGEHRCAAWWHIHRLMYDWTLAWAYRPSASVALFVLSFTESIFFPVPPDVLLMPLVLGNRRKWLRYFMTCSLASVAGAVAAFLIGWLAWWAVKDFAFKWLGWSGLTEANFDTVSLWFEKYNFWIVFLAGFTPLPFKIFNIFAGVFGTGPEVSSPVMFFVMFLLAAIVSRSARFFIVAWLMHRFGTKITPFIDRYFNLLSLVFGILLVGGFIVVKYVF